MNLQVIKSISGKDEYVLLPVNIYHRLRANIDRLLQEPDYELFDLKDYVENPVARLRIKAGMTQQQLAEQLAVSQAYISKIENQQKVSAKVLAKIRKLLGFS